MKLNTTCYPAPRDANMYGILSLILYNNTAIVEVMRRETTEN